MSITRIVILLVLLVAVIGGSGYFCYEFFVLPQKVIQEEKHAAAAAAPTPTPDYSIAEFEKIQPMQAGGNLIEARDAYLAFIEKYPSSSKLSDARKAVGAVNTQILFSDMRAPNKQEYVVVSGDALAKIQSKTKTPMDLIYRANNLPSINLQIGQVLLIPKIQFSVVVNRAQKTLSLMEDGKLFKEYPIISYKGPGSTGAAVTSTVKEKIASVGDKRVAFGAKEYADADRWIMLANSGINIRGVAGAPAPGAESALPSGILLDKPDIDEVYVLVTRGTPVTIE